ncbi:MAG: hypothetical protein EAX89_01285 [Candidatus Lokiarchaeota archaeon]|nr:hypothetical protein [Candidatus Lokiarchaeota archaeon]
MSIINSSTFPKIDNQADLERKREMGKTFLFCVLFILLIFLFSNVYMYGDLISLFTIITIILTILLLYLYPKIHNTINQNQSSKKPNEMVILEQDIFNFLVKNQGISYRKEEIINIYLNNKKFDVDSTIIKEAISNLANSNKVTCIIISGELSFLVEK